VRPTITRLARTTATVLVAAALAGGLLVAPTPTDARRNARIDIDAFMTGLACIESGGSYTALNSRTGAYGKYQIMPRNWPAWAARYMRNKWAQPTPRNQEYVARQRILDLYELRGNWRRVAYWWLTGNGEGNEHQWSSRALGYVNRVMSITELASSPRYAELVPAGCFPRNYPPPKIRTQPRQHVVVTGRVVHLRSGPGYHNDAVGVVRNGVRLTVLRSGLDARGKTWLKVGLADGRVAWIASWFTAPI
jgi:hypothetical protein